MTGGASAGSAWMYFSMFMGVPSGLCIETTKANRFGCIHRVANGLRAEQMAAFRQPVMKTWLTKDEGRAPFRAAA